MRLNLLPTTVKKGTQVRAAWFISVIIAAACIIVAVLMVLKSGKDRQFAFDQAEAKKPAYEATKKLQQETVTRMSTDIVGLERNVNLYSAMDEHIDKYPNLYNGVKDYIPSFFRVTEIQAEPAGGTTVLTLTGVIGSYQDYADLMLALLRIPAPIGEVTSISRSGFQHTEAFVPPIDEQDQSGRPRKPGSDSVPDDPLKRLEYFINQGAKTPAGYQGLNNFGSGQIGARGPRANESLITVRLVLPYKLETPDPRATLSLFASGAPATGTGGTGPAPAGPQGTAPVGPGRTLPAPGGRGPGASAN